MMVLFATKVAVDHNWEEYMFSISSISMDRALGIRSPKCIILALPILDTFLDLWNPMGCQTMYPHEMMAMLKGIASWGYYTFV